MLLVARWYKQFAPIAVYGDGQILGYRNGWLCTMKQDGEISRICKMPNTSIDRMKESIRLINRVFRKDVRTSCITDSEDVYFFKSKRFYRYKRHAHEAEEIKMMPPASSIPLNITPTLKETRHILLWGDYSSNNSREVVNIWGLTKGDKVEIVYQFQAGSVRHVHNIVPDENGKGYYIFTGDNDEKAGIYYSNTDFSEVTPLFTGNQKARAVQGYYFENGIIYATDSVCEQNYICFLKKKNGAWEHQVIAPIDGSCIYATRRQNKLYFSTTVEAQETENQNMFLAYLSTKRGTGILSNHVEIISVDKQLNIKKEFVFEKDSLPYKLFQYGVVMFPPSLSETLVIYPVGVKKYDGHMGIMDCQEECR